MKRWAKRIAVGLVVLILAGWAALYFWAREPYRPVVRMPASGRIVLTGVTVVDPASGGKTPGSFILMQDGKILSVGTDDPAAGDGAVRRVDLSGKFVAPGFNDMHAHPLGVADPSGTLGLMLANGVTGFRQMQGSDAMLSQRAESRLPTGPLAPAALILPGALLTPLNASTPERAIAMVRHEKAQGADFIKVGLVSKPVLYALLPEARRQGLPVAGHVPPGVDIVDAARRGMHAIEHLGPGQGALVACSSRNAELRRELDALPTMKGPPFTPPFADKLADWLLHRLVINPATMTTPADTKRRAVILASFDEARCRTVARALRDAGNWQVPTLIRRKTTEQADRPEFARDPALRYLPPATLQLWKDVTAEYVEKVPADARALMRREYDLDLRLVKLFDEEGVPMLTGSDESGAWAVAGFSLHAEFDELAKAGLSPLRILQMSTSDAARFLGRTETMGRVAPGADADLVILDGDPTADVRNMHRIAGVVRAGFYHDRAALDRLLARIEAGKGYVR
ncbi:MAG: amidohydrolase family protein [Sphingobium sp.]